MDHGHMDHGGMGHGGMDMGSKCKMSVRITEANEDIEALTALSRCYLHGILPISASSSLAGMSIQHLPSSSPYLGSSSSQLAMSWFETPADATSRRARSI